MSRTIVSMKANSLELCKDAADLGNPALLCDERQEGEHEAAETCWCCPALIYTAPNGNRVWRHNKRKQ